MTGYFDLRALIRDVVTASESPDPGVIAKVVLGEISPEQRDSALEQAMRPIVREVITQLRVPLRSQTSVANSDGHGTNATQGDTPSRKVAAIRDLIGRGLRNMVAVGPGASDWKFLGECAVNDLLYAAQLRREQARRTAASAERYEELAEALVTHQAGTVQDLPKAVLSEFLSGIRRSPRGNEL